MGRNFQNRNLGSHGLREYNPIKINLIMITTEVSHLPYQTAGYIGNDCFSCCLTTKNELAIISLLLGPRHSHTRHS